MLGAVQFLVEIDQPEIKRGSMNFHPNAKCNAVDEWKICGVAYKEHGNIKHEFVRRVKHKTHIEFNSVFVQCGWAYENVYDVCEPDLEVLREHYRTGVICTNCLKKYIFIVTRDAFLKLN